MTKAENIFRATRHEILMVIAHGTLNLSDNWVMAGWCYGKTAEGQRFMSQRTLNAVKGLIDKEAKRLDSCDRFEIEYGQELREAIRVLNDMVEREQRELDKEKQMRRDRKTMSYDNWMAKYYPQYC